MTRICPKCRHARQATDTVPTWQCPACGVAYAKAADAVRAPALPMTPCSATCAQAGDMLLYSAPWCPYCTSAKGWMGQYGFKYEECDIQARAECADQLKALGSDGAFRHASRIGARSQARWS